MRFCGWTTKLRTRNRTIVHRSSWFYYFVNCSLLSAFSVLNRILNFNWLLLNLIYKIICTRRLVNLNTFIVLTVNSFLKHPLKYWVYILFEHLNIVEIFKQNNFRNSTLIAFDVIICKGYDGWEIHCSGFVKKKMNWSRMWKWFILEYANFFARRYLKWKHCCHFFHSFQSLSTSSI